MTDIQTRRRFTAEEKARAVALAETKGLTAASAELGVAKTTLWRWRGKGEGETAAPVAAPALVPAPVSAPVPVPASPPAPAPARPVSRSWTPSQRARILEHAASHGVSAAAKTYRVSRFSVYDWQRKVSVAAKGDGPSPTSGLGATEIEARRDQEILSEWKRHPGLGPSQIKNQLRRAGVKVSVHTTRRVMEEAGYRPPKVRRQAHDQRYEAVRPNQWWHLDFVHRNINRSSVFTLVILDDFSRYAVGSGLDDAERADLVIEAFEAAVARHGRPEGCTAHPPDPPFCS